jgi:hypothetical protein
MQENSMSNMQKVTTVKINRHDACRNKTYHTKHTPLNTKIYANVNFYIIAEQYSQCGSSTT